MSIENQRDLNRYTISIYDFDQSINFLRMAEQYSGDPLVCEALLVSAVIYYCRPFSSNERGSAEASSRMEIDSFADISKDERALHDQCMTIRNKALAHAEWTYYPTQHDSRTNVIASRRYPILSESIEWTSLGELAGKIMGQCDHQRANYLRRPNLT
jgi:hypothetical protein